ncbi:Peptidase A1 [Corchorus capsularis]|uniref:Peptidase A1 n=1 Tax=Corchorus capsularis TaxID=210143 RepID=A0A1R3GD18_COCAP|nr:Peptidase A1 [Corchorus capsularis]
METWRSTVLILAVFLAFVSVDVAAVVTYSSRLIHRFSDEAKLLRFPRNGGGVRWPERKSLEYYELLVNSDFQRQKMKLGPKYDLVFPSQGSKTMSFGNDFGWLHYTWIDIGTPNVSFLVALDVGSDLLWVPCDCVQCAPLSASYYSSLDKDLSEYRPTGSSTSRHIPCSHQLCDSSPNCKSSKQQCPYTVDYYTENTSSSGLLVEDMLHLASASGHMLNSSVRAPVIIGCGMKQSGGYLDGVAPDGLMGLGPGEISVPSFLAKAGLIRNSFSMCFDEEDSGRIYFGDEGPPTQQSTQFLLSDGKYMTYIVAVEACCVGDSCLKQTGFSAVVDSGTSFTFLPNEVYERIAKEFDRRVNATITSYPGYPWEYCYKSSSQELPKVPYLNLMFPSNNSFVVYNPVFVVYGLQGVSGFCLAIQPVEGDVGTIGQNFMTGYRMVFNREDMKLGWSPSNCQDLADGKRMSLSPNGTPSNPLPTNEQQSTPGGRAVAPALAGRAPSRPSVAPTRLVSSQFCYLKLLPMLILLHVLISSFPLDTAPHW